MTRIKISTFAFIGAVALSGVAVAGGPTPQAAPPQEKTYKVTLSSRDLQAIGFAVQHVGEKCSPQAEDYCQAQLALDRTAQSLTRQVRAQAETAKPDPAPPKK